MLRETAQETAEPKDPRRRGKAWRLVGRGVKVDSALTGRAALLAELRAWQEVLPSSVVWTGLTGCEVHGLWMPEPVPEAPRFLAMSTAPGQVCPERAQLAPTRQTAPPRGVDVEGATVEPVADCIRAAARFLPTLDLVVLMDSALQLERCTLADLEAAARTRLRGARQMREALPLVDGRSESAMETLLRLLHVVCGIPVDVQVELFDAYGAFVARVDLRVSGTGMAPEYDGAEHKKTQRQRADLKRWGRLADIGVDRRGYVLQDLLEHSYLILRAADTALGRSRPTDVGPWLQMVGASLYQPGGRRAFLERVRANWRHLRPRAVPPAAS